MHKTTRNEISESAHVDDKMNFSDSQKSSSLQKEDIVVASDIIQKDDMLELIHKAIKATLKNEQMSFPKPSDMSEDMMKKENVFVTIRRGDALVGCVGNTTPEPLARVIIKNAKGALTDRLRDHLLFEDVDADSLNITVSILSPFVEIPFTTKEDLIKKLESGKGLLLKKDRKKVLFLPEVWKAYPFAEQFLENLELKGRLKEEDWDGQIQAYKFTVQEFSEPEKKKNWRNYQIDMGQKALRNMVSENGDIIYGYDFQNLSYLTEDISQVRQMGTIMAIAYSLYKTNDQTLIPFLKKSFEHVEEEKLLEQPDFKVGAKALLLVATLYYEKATGKTLELRKNLVNHLIEAYRPDVGFLTNNSSQKTSPFYNGESWVALSLYNSFYPNDTKVKELMPSVDRTMLNKYSSDNIDNPFFSHALQAAAIRFEQTHDDKFRYYMKEISLKLIKKRHFTSASTCAVLEGIVAVARSIRNEEPELFSMLYDYMTANLRFVSLLQIVDKNPFSQDKNFDSQSKRFEGSFLTIYHQPITRCDSTAHCTLVLMNYNEL